MSREKQEFHERKKKGYRTLYKKDVPFRETPFRKKHKEKKK
jgi:hypothetical protein